MAFRPSQQARLYVGILAAHAYSRTAGTAAAVDMIDTTTLDKTAKTLIPGLDTSTFQCAGPLDTDPASNAQYDALSDIKAATTPTPITFLPLGTDGAAWLLNGIETQIDVQASNTSTVDYAFAAQTTGNTDTNGVILENNTTVTIDTNGTAVDNGAGTTQGAVLHLHVTAYATLTSDAIIVQHSTTGAFSGEQTTLATFTTVTGLTSQRLEVTGTVNRHLRVVDDVTGAGSITRLVAISRR